MCRSTHTSRTPRLLILLILVAATIVISTALRPKPATAQQRQRSGIEIARPSGQSQNQSRHLSLPNQTYSGTNIITQSLVIDARLPLRPVDVTPTPDADLEPGFPVYCDMTPGSYAGGVAIHTLVGNIDQEPDLEIVVTALATGPLYAWKSDGSLVSGWPVTDYDGAGYPAMGHLTAGNSVFDVFSGHWGNPYERSHLYAYSGGGTILPGWPRTTANYLRSPAALADVDGDGIDEIFIEEEDRYLHGYKADGSILPGWPAGDGTGDQERHTPAIADIDRDGKLEILTGSSPLDPGGVYLYAYHHDASPVAGFPAQFPQSNLPDTYPVVGDVDGDGSLEIVAFASEYGYGVIKILSTNGTVKRTILPSTLGIYYSVTPTPVLADLDGDGIPEILLQGSNFVFAWKGDGTVMPGWPVIWSGSGIWSNNSAPVVGDIDGDQQPDVVVVSAKEFSGVIGHVRVYDRFGNPNPHFPKEIPIGRGAVPAIADIDNDGRTEIVVTGSPWDGYYLYPKVWVYDLHGPQPYGPIEWGQFGGNPQHTGLYESPLATPTPTPHAGRFQDVPPSNSFYQYVECMGSLSIISGYPCGSPGELCIPDDKPYFRPNANLTRAQLSKIVSNSAGYNNAPTGQTFADVPTAHPFYQWIERVASHGVISGYTCGGEGEPCDGQNRPYFRPFNNMTRGQLSKVVAIAGGINDPASTQTFTDVPSTHPFYMWIECVAGRYIIGGYTCGGDGEPCDEQNRPYFRPYNDVTRGQASKINTNTFFPGCQLATATPTTTSTVTPVTTSTSIATTTPTAIEPTPTMLTR
jgi:hypothetical protein